MLVAISDGHELTTSGKRTPPIEELGGRVILENEFNKAVALLLEKELRRCGVGVLNVSSTDSDSLFDRVNRANNAHADIFVAIHYNAYRGEFGSRAEGIETFHYPNSVEGKRLADCVHAELIKGTEQKNRGVKSANFYVLKNTKMPAILTENGFMDNKREALLMIDNDFQQEVATEHARGICKYLDVEYVEKKSPETKRVPKWAEESWAWAKENGLNDGVVQNEFEIQMVKMLYDYHLKFGR